MIKHHKAVILSFFLVWTGGQTPSSAQDRSYLPPSQQGGGGDNSPRQITPSYQNRGSNSGDANPGYGQPYSSPPVYAPDDGRRDRGDYNSRATEQSSYSSHEIVQAGHHFFGEVSEGLAKVVEYVFSRNGRPVGYILGQEGGGAVIAGLRYGEGTLYTKLFPPQKVFWQGPSIGYDFGADGSKSMTLVYNLTDPGQIYDRFGGVDGSAYLIGGVGVTFQTSNTLTLAPIRAGLGLRLGANIGYLKYTPQPTWNPF